jgi:hypothetical protein
MKNQDNVSSQKSQHNSTPKSKANELSKMAEREFRNLLSKIIIDLKEDSNKQMKLGDQFKT